MTSALKTMHIDLRVGESLRLGDAVLTLKEKSGRLARLTVRAPGAVQVRQQPGAQECASSPHWGSKEQAHVRAAASI
jgi:hypothetical protein